MKYNTEWLRRNQNELESIINDPYFDIDEHDKNHLRELLEKEREKTQKLDEFYKNKK